ncbi:MAG TPA: glycerol permease, partial [Methanocorpusculum sp.]|nr:glycerol permease [Methanocorpusculum sp.]
TAETTELGPDATWNVRISAKIGTDTFSISLNRDSMTISGYADDATKEAVDTWADTKPTLN